MTATEPIAKPIPSWRRAGDGRIGGVGVDPTFVANSILRRSFDDFEPVNLMKLQRLMYFVACLYSRQSGRRLLVEPFQPWASGPVVASLHDRLKGLEGKPISKYIKGADGRLTFVKDVPGSDFRRSLDLVWGNLSGYTAGDLARLIKVEGSAWYKAWVAKSSYIDEADMADDDTFLSRIGLENL